MKSWTMNVQPLIAFAVTVLLTPGAAPAAESGSPRPNIIVILADDMGFSDLGCYGGEIRTPNLDRLAAQGLRFSQFYNCALCGPSRSALMTGLHPHQVGISNWTGLLNNRCVTVFELLNRAGYATGAVGRLDMVTADNWHEPAHIGRHVNRYFGSTGHQGPGNYFKDVRNNAFYRDGEPYSIPDGGYKTDLITEFATEFIRGVDRLRPFFLYMAHYAPHWPLHAKPEDIAKYRDLYHRLGWDQARQQRLERLLASGILPAGTRLAPRDSRAVAWEKARFKDWEAERMAVYAAQIDCLDQSVGRVIKALRDRGVEKQTLIIFLSDNGASDQACGQLDKPGQTWRIDGTSTRVGNRPDIQPGPADHFVTAGPAWSCVANTPFREHKNTNYEGGIASPLIVWWSQVGRAGGVSAELSHITDIPATILDVAGVAYPAHFASRHVTPLAGKSLLPVLKDKRRHGHATLCWSTSGSRAVREGDWKLVARKGGRWELYDLGRDRSELDNLAEAHPERAAKMAKVFEGWQGR
jgi:arylsulfatase